MKKLFKFYTAIVLFFAMGLNATAATLGNTPKIKNIRVGETGYSSANPIHSIIVNTSNNAEATNVGVTIEPIGKSPEPSAKSFTLKPVNKNENRFVSTDLTFKTSALDFEYRVTATMYDEKGNKVGEPETAWVTVDAKGENHEPDACNSKLTMDGATITSTFDEKGNQNIHFDLPLQVKKGNPSVSFFKMTEWTHVAITHSNAKTGYIQTVSSTPKFNEKTGTFEADFSFTNTDKENYWIPEAIDLRLINPCGDKFYFDAKPFSNQIQRVVELDGTFRKGTPDNCGKLDLDSVYWKVGAYDKTTGTTPVFVYFPKNHIKNGGNGTITFEFANTGDQPRISVTNSTNETQNAAMKLNEKTGWYEATLSFKDLTAGSFELFQVDIALRNACGESFYFSGNMKKVVNKGEGKFAAEMQIVHQKKGNSNNNDSCNTKYKLKEVDFETATTGGIYTMQFSFNFGNNSDAPSQVVMVAQLTNCKGETVNIKLKMQYNATTGTYYCGQSIPQNKDCEWKLTYAEVGAYNPCKELTWWGLDFSQLKGNGKGTRDATTASNGKPGLL